MWVDRLTRKNMLIMLVIGLLWGIVFARYGWHGWPILLAAWPLETEPWA